MDQDLKLFQPFPKMARLSRECVITEKIDGTNAQVVVTDAGEVLAGSRNRWIYPGKQDNFGFAAWVKDKEDELRKLGPGRHYGEWWGQGIQRTYGRTDKVFSLFNTHRWSDPSVRPACCSVVPVLYRGDFHTLNIEAALARLRHFGSTAAPGFMNPEGIVIFHTASGQLFKKTIKDDESPKGLVKAA